MVDTKYKYEKELKELCEMIEERQRQISKLQDEIRLLNEVRE